MIIERNCFVCEGFGHITHHCKNMGEEESMPMLLNKFEILKSRVMQREEGNRKEEEKDRRMILREEKLKKEKIIEVRKTEVEKMEEG